MENVTYLLPFWRVEFINNTCSVYRAWGNNKAAIATGVDLGGAAYAVFNNTSLAVCGAVEVVPPVACGDIERAECYPIPSLNLCNSLVAISINHIDLAPGANAPVTAFILLEPLGDHRIGWRGVLIPFPFNQGPLAVIHKRLSGS